MGATQNFVTRHQKMGDYLGFYFVIKTQYFSGISTTLTQLFPCIYMMLTRNFVAMHQTIVDCLVFHFNIKTQHFSGHLNNSHPAWWRISPTIWLGATQNFVPMHQKMGDYLGCYFDIKTQHFSSISTTLTHFFPGNLDGGHMKLCNSASDKRWLSSVPLQH